MLGLGRFTRHLSVSLSRSLLTFWVLTAMTAGCATETPVPTVTGTGAGLEVDPGATGTLVQLHQGLVQGKLVGATREFLGIPYAAPPLAELRFMPPQPVAAWDATRDATSFGPSCPQPTSALSIQGPTDENCLFLNVYAPATIDAPLPVMVFIHGGAFMRSGAVAYDGRALSEAGRVLIVTLNYRLGPLGFLSHPDLDATRDSVPSGSDGIRDQQLALHFVQDNIVAFGGDPANITLFGESAGAVSTCVHYVSPSSRGLAQRFIMESGSCVGGGYGMATKAAADARGTQLAGELCADQPDVLACLRELPVATLVNWQSTKQPFGANWTPTVEGAGGVLPDSPEQLMEEPCPEPRPALLGTNKNEWLLYQLLGQAPVTTVDMLNGLIDQQFGDSAWQVKQQYQASADADANAVYLRLTTDIMFRCPTRVFARAASRHHNPVYLYSFEQGLAYHGQELDYVFARTPAASSPPLSPTLLQAVQGYWTQFASAGDPNGADRPDWPRYKKHSDENMTLVDALAQASGLSASDCDFWEEFVRCGGVINLGL
jgi:para-nitrobenzyl esterase